jgi:peptidoglycan hydrolase-like protein with peptidoglycan-binding domain
MVRRRWIVLERLFAGMILGSVIALPAIAENAPDGSSFSSKPSFECSQAQDSVSSILCADQDGALADWDMTSAGLALKGSLDRVDRQAFARDEIFWIRELTRACALPPAPSRISTDQKSCVLRAYHERAEFYRRELNGDALAESKLGPEDHARIQNALVALGFLQDRPDGKFGPRTRDAIRRYQFSRKLPQKGFLTTKSIRQLLADYPDVQNRTVADLGNGFPEDAVQGRPSEPASTGQARDQTSSAPSSNSPVADVRDQKAQKIVPATDRARSLAEEQVANERAARVAAEERAAAAEKRAGEAEAAEQALEKALAKAAMATQFGWRESALLGVALFGVICAFCGGLAFARPKTADVPARDAFNAATPPASRYDERMDLSHISEKQTIRASAVAGAASVEDQVSLQNSQVNAEGKLHYRTPRKARPHHAGRSAKRSKHAAANEGPAAEPAPAGAGNENSAQPTQASPTPRLENAIFPAQS